MKFTYYIRKPDKKWANEMLKKWYMLRGNLDSKQKPEVKKDGC